MLTMPGRYGHRVFALLAAVLLTACSATPVLHEFPAPLAPESRPPAAVNYTLREADAGAGNWLLRGEQGDVVGGFRWQRDFSGSAESSRGQFFQDGINQRDYVFRLGAGADDAASRGWDMAPPRITIFNAATGERVGELELRTGFESRFEGMWQGRRILWRAEFLPGGSVERDGVEDFYPSAQLLHWTGGSNADLRVYSGRAVAGEPPAFAELLLDVAAGRPLTRRELGDAMVLLFAIRALEQVEGAEKAE